MFTELAYQASTKCDDLIFIDHVEKTPQFIELYCRSLAKSGPNGNMRLVEILNNIYSFTKNGEPVAEIIPTGFLVRCCSQTNTLAKPYVEQIKRENVC